MQTSTLICHCGNTKQIEGNSNKGMDIKSEGWGVIATFDGKLLKSCPACHKKLKQLATRIFDMTGNKYVSLSGLIDR